MKIKQNSTAQGTIEYLVILAVVVVIGLAVVAISSGFFDNAVLETQGGKQLLGSVSSNIVVREAIIDNEGTALLSLENNTSEDLILTKITLDGTETPYNELINSGSNTIFSIPSLSCVCSSGEITKTCTYEIYTTSRYGLEKKEIYEVKLECVSEAVADGEVKEPTYPIDGECGSAIEEIFFTAPTTNLCVSGNATTVDLNETNTGWDWTCNGINDGENSETCEAERNLGSGTTIDPYTILNCQELQDMNQNLSENYILLNDIDCSDTINWNGGLGFQPVGNFTTPFNGNLDGSGFSVTDLTIIRPEDNFIGLFGVIQDSLITSLNLQDINFIGDSTVAGITAEMHNSIILNSSTTGKISGGDYAGGLTAFMYNSLISKSYSEVNLTGISSVGGLAGGIQVQKSSIVNSYSTGDVTGEYAVGGLVGSVISTTMDLNESYSISKVSAEYESGGLVGALTFGDTINSNNSFWNIETSEQNTSNGGIGKTTAQMTYDYDEEGTFDDWDFETIWAEDTTSTINDGYPYLQWQTE